MLAWHEGVRWEILMTIHLLSQLEKSSCSIGISTGPIKSYKLVSWILHTSRNCQILHFLWIYIPAFAFLPYFLRVAMDRKANLKLEF